MVVMRQHQRVTMWKDQLSGSTPARVGYSEAGCPNGVQYCSDATAWASCCYDIYGTYTIGVNSAYAYLTAAGWRGELPFIMLGLMARESSFTPDVIAVCPQCCCTAAGVWAVGLLQFEQIGHFNTRGELTGDSSMSFADFTAWLKQPLNNCMAALYLYNNGGLAHWTPLNGLDSDSSIAYWRGQVTDLGTTVPEPGTSLASDIEAAPQPSTAPPLIAAGPQPVVTPPTPQVSVNLIDNPAEYSTARSGWDAVTWHYTNDVPYYTGYDAEVVRRLTSLLGG